MNLREEALRQEQILVGEPAGGEDARLLPQNNFPVRAWLPGSFFLRDGGWGKVRKPSKQTIQSLQMSPGMGSLRQGDVLHLLAVHHRWEGSSGYLPEAGHYVGLITKKG